MLQSGDLVEQMAHSARHHRFKSALDNCWTGVFATDIPVRSSTVFFFVVESRVFCSIFPIVLVFYVFFKLSW